MQYILCAVLGLCFFIVPVICYDRGIKTGLRISHGKEPEPIRTPVKVVTDYKQEKQAKAESEQFIQGLQNILTYDGTPQKGGE